MPKPPPPPFNAKSPREHGSMQYKRTKRQIPPPPPICDKDRTCSNSKQPRYSPHPSTTRVGSAPATMEISSPPTPRCSDAEPAAVRAGPGARPAEAPPGAPSLCRGEDGREEHISPQETTTVSQHQAHLCVRLAVLEHARDDA